MSTTVIRTIEPRSPAHRAGVRVGDTLLEINGKRVLDVLDYKFHSYEATITLTLADPAGTQRTLQIRKAEGQDLGLEFESYLMDNARSCSNQCIFCFVDQLPPGMRQSLYFKDDDARLSFLMGNYITLTNLSDREVARICQMRISPVNISVHTTDPVLRVRMLGHRQAGRGIEVMERMARAGITMNCQIVSCPGVNDGPALHRTLTDLAELYPAVNSVCVVPVGVTKFRQGLYPLEPYTQQGALAVLDQVEAFAEVHLAQTGTRLVWCSDEFYLTAKRALPPEDYFEDFVQLDNGVGMLRLFLGEFGRALQDTDADTLAAAPACAIATGVSAAPFLARLVEQIQEKCPAFQGRVYQIVNHFFGENITVAGLVTGRDLIAQLQGKPLGAQLFIPETMLRSGERVFLDDITLEDVELALNVPVVPVAQDGYELLEAMCRPIPAAHAPETPPPPGEYFAYRPGQSANN